MAVDLTEEMFKVEMKALEAQNEKFYLASSDGQVLFLATPDEVTQEAMPLTDITTVADYLVNSTDATEAELADLRAQFKQDYYPTLQNLSKPYDMVYFKDGSKDGDSFAEKSLIFAPIKVSLAHTSVDDYAEEINEERTISFYIGVVPLTQKVSVDVFTLEDLKFYAMIVATLILSLLLSTYCVFQTSHAVIKPLRILN